MAARRGKIDRTIWHLADLEDVAVTCWTLVLQLLGDNAQAEAVLEDAVTERPESPRLRRQMIEFYLKAGREKDALAQCRLLPDDFPWREEMPSVVKGARLVALHRTAAGLVHLRRAFQAGCRDALCLRWLAAANLAVGNLAEVETVIAEWHRHEPGNLEIIALRHAAAQRQSNRPAVAEAFRVDSAARPGLPIEPPKNATISTTSRI
jgi:predicted Zn-dependent protease